MNQFERNLEIYRLRKENKTPLKEICARFNLSRGRIMNICRQYIAYERMGVTEMHELYDLCAKHCDSNYSHCINIMTVLANYKIKTVEEFKKCKKEQIKTMRGIGNVYRPIVENMLAEATLPKDPPVLKMTLCEARHLTPEKDGAIYPYVIRDVTNVEELEKSARDRIWQACYTKYKYGKQGFLIKNQKEVSAELTFDPRLHIDLYVMGLTVALVAVVNVCLKENIDITLWHHDRTTDNFYPQDIYQG